MLLNIFVFVCIKFVYSLKRRNSSKAKCERLKWHLFKCNAFLNRTGHQESLIQDLSFSFFSRVFQVYSKLCKLSFLLDSPSIFVFILFSTFQLLRNDELYVCSPDNWHTEKENILFLGFAIQHFQLESIGFFSPTLLPSNSFRLKRMSLFAGMSNGKHYDVVNSGHIGCFMW